MKDIATQSNEIKAFLEEAAKAGYQKDQIAEFIKDHSLPDKQMNTLKAALSMKDNYKNGFK